MVLLGVSCGVAFFGGCGEGVCAGVFCLVVLLSYGLFGVFTGCVFIIVGCLCALSLSLLTVIFFLSFCFGGFVFFGFLFVDFVLFFCVVRCFCFVFGWVFG